LHDLDQSSRGWRRINESLGNSCRVEEAAGNAEREDKGLTARLRNAVNAHCFVNRSGFIDN